MAFRPEQCRWRESPTPKTVGIQAQATCTQAVQGVQGIANDHLLGGEGRVQPVQRWLAFLEVVQVHPAPGLAIYTGHRRRGAPVGFLHTWFEEDNPLQLADDVMAGLELVALGRQQVDRVAPGRHFGQQRPVFLADFDHVVQPRIGTVGQLGQAKVGALARVRGDQVVDGHGVVRGGHAAHLDQLLLAAVQRIDVETDAVEVAVHAGVSSRPRMPPDNLIGPVCRP